LTPPSPEWRIVGEQASSVRLELTSCVAAPAVAVKLLLPEDVHHAADAGRFCVARVPSAKRSCRAKLGAVATIRVAGTLVVVVAVDPRWLLRSIAAHYADLFQGEDGACGPDLARPCSTDRRRAGAASRHAKETVSPMFAVIDAGWLVMLAGTTTKMNVANTLLARP
jgi:hypothetical protein